MHACVSKQLVDEHLCHLYSWWIQVRFAMDPNVDDEILTAL